jgi:hypothetical protein
MCWQGVYKPLVLAIDLLSTQVIAGHRRVWVIIGQTNDDRDDGPKNSCKIFIGVHLK